MELDEKDGGMATRLFTSESVSIGHPDKIADQVSDAVLDECLRQDPNSRVACETLVAPGLVVLAGEITTRAHLDYQAIVRRTIRRIGYVDPRLGFDYRSCGVVVSMNKQSPDIAMGVTEGQGLHREQGAGDQGMMFGYACDETDVLMPLPITIAHRLMDELYTLREGGVLSYLRPDAKSQVTVEYDPQGRPKRVDAIVISTQHAETVEHTTIVEDMEAMARRIVPDHLMDDQTRFFINPTGRFVLGGPVADCGLTGRKTMVDSYGGMSRHGGGCFSGKDPSKVDRSGAYAARYVAKTVVAAGLARRCEVQIAYAIGVAQPVSVRLDTMGTNTLPEEEICRAILQIFDLTPRGIIEMLNLKRPIYERIAYGGHFGRADLDLPWERLDRVDALEECLALKGGEAMRPSSFAFRIAG
jgi:S-adenosylmethionine synthetase